MREARRGQGSTLDDVATSAGVTKSFVSAVERGETAPSIGSLYRMCEVLGVSMSTLFETVASPDATVVRRAEVEGAFFGGRGVVNYVLSPRAKRRAQVVEGAVEFRFGDRATVLQAGDTISYAPSEPHSWRNPDAAVALFFQIPAEY